MKKKIILLPFIIFMIFMLTSCSVSFGIPDENIEEGTVITKGKIVDGFRYNTDYAAFDTETTISEIISESSVNTIDDDEFFIEEILNNMTVHQKIAQMILARCPSDAEEQMKKYQFGGYTLYGRDFKWETPSSVKKRIENIQSNAIIPSFIAVDEEGGNIVRISNNTAFAKNPFLSPQNMLKNNALEEDTNEKSRLLLSLGINFNLAPVADVTENKSDYMYSRTFGLPAGETGEYIADIVEIMNDNGLASCLKHFPGYGSNVDTHTGIAVDTRSKSEFEENDFIPFEYGINAGCSAVLINHNIINAYNDSLPASLAPEIHDVLRNELGFDGVIVTDDLGMDAIKLYSGSDNINVLAVLAGNDLLCVTDSIDCYNDIIKGYNDGIISEERLDESVRRILKMKKQYGII